MLCEHQVFHLVRSTQGHEAHAATSMGNSTYQDHSSVTCGKAQHCKAWRFQHVRNVVTMDVPHLSVGIEVSENSVVEGREERGRIR